MRELLEPERLPPLRVLTEAGVEDPSTVDVGHPHVVVQLPEMVFGRPTQLVESRVVVLALDLDKVHLPLVSEDAVDEAADALLGPHSEDLVSPNHQPAHIADDPLVLEGE